MRGVHFERSYRLFAYLSPIVLLATLAVGYRVWPRSLKARVTPQFPVYTFHAGQPVLEVPNSHVVANVYKGSDELPAYVIFDHIRDTGAIAPASPLITAQVTAREAAYVIIAELPNNLLTSIPLLAQLKINGIIPNAGWGLATKSALGKWKQQTELFEAAYDLPVRRARAAVPRSPPIRSLTSDGSPRLAADMIAVAEFFAIPLDFFLGIGALQEQVSTSPGHPLWKRRADPTDMILKRQTERILVLTKSSGPWAITQDTLRYTHQLFLADLRDYSTLPAHLRPPQKLDLNELPAEALPTYAGRLFRDLLDRFRGDSVNAVRAYNSGPENPDRYEVGVRRVALYARKALEHAVAVNEMTALRERSRH